MRTQNIQPVTNPDQIRALIAHEKSVGAYRPIGWSSYAAPLKPNAISNESLVLHCTKCNNNTSGIYEVADVIRRCPACRSLLMYCPACKSCASATEKFSVISCDRCSADFVTNTTVEYLASRDRASREIVLSGIRAIGELHLGNLFGAVQQFVEYEHGDNFCMYFIADWHTLTTLRDPRKVALNSLAIATDYLAAGLNPERSVIYSQSSVPEIAELALYLSMVQPKLQLEHLPTVKDLAKDKHSTMYMGHLHYPLLMAADILGPKATLVPVGYDQAPNVELAMSLADKFNRQFGTTFVTPKMSLNKVVPGLAGGKMGKSNEDSSVLLSDTLDQISEKYLRYGITDKRRSTRSAPGNPSQCVSVYPMYEALLEKRPEEIKIVETECREGSRGCRECKLQLSREIDALLQPFRERRAELSEKQKYVEEVLHYGGLKAREIIQHTLWEVRERLGILSH